MLTLTPVDGDRSDLYRALKQFQLIIFQAAVWLNFAGWVGFGHAASMGRNPRHKNSDRVAKQKTLAIATG